MLISDNSHTIQQDCIGDQQVKATDGFSLLISIYKNESAEYFSLCLQSLCEQTLPPNEIVLVLDGPIEAELKKVIEHFNEKLNINMVGYTENKGLGFALNFGLERCQYELVARMDADDICLPERFEKQVAFMQANASVDICGGYAQNIDENGDEKSLRKMPTETSEITRLIWSCPIIHPSVMFRKSKILSIGNYDVNTPYRQDDYELWIRAVRAGLIIANIDEALIKYRVYNHSKNNLNVACNRFKIGFSAIKEFDDRFIAYMSLLFPIACLILPRKVVVWLKSKFDPRIVR